MNDSYLEQCIRALPMEKQAAARAAFKEISESGDDSVFSKVLVTLEATGAYAATIPHDLAACGEKLLREFDARTSQLAKEQTAAETQRDERMRRLFSEQVPQLGKSLALDQVVEALAVQTAEIGRLQRSVARLRRARLGGLVFLMILGAFCGAGVLGSIYWKRYEQALQAYRFFSRLDASGIHLEVRRTDQGEQLTVVGRPILIGTAWKKNANGEVVGANLVFPAGGGQ